MVLGVNWLCQLGPINWDFVHMMLKFLIVGKQVVLQGISRELGIHPSTFSLSIEPDPNQDLQSLLEEYSDIFVDPVGLPPTRDAHIRSFFL